MDAADGRLLELVRALDALGPSPTLIQLARAVEEARLTIADVAAHVRANPRGYHRASIALRDQYELLVMTWLPGQTSVPHDHAGSICALQVVQGHAVETCYRVAADGYVDLEFATPLREGEITAGQDSAVHTVRNPAESVQTLVTVHVYAPPLREFRQFVPRPERHLPERAPRRVPTVAIVGGGFSGAMSAAQILRRARRLGRSMRVALVERRGSVGEGLAYGTRDLSHLLNVPAGNMSAWPDRPNDFVNWAAERHGNARAADFLPRAWYGEYVRETMLAEASAGNAAAKLDVVFDEVRRVARHPERGWMVHLARGSSLRADAVVLAIGHRPPSDPIGAQWTGPRTRFIANPWRPFAMNMVGSDEPVVVLGSGLTAVDTVLSLAQEARRAPITLISRHGLVPQAHTAAPVAPARLQSLVADLVAMPGGVSVRTVFRMLRDKVRLLARAGVDWRSVVDGLRPHTAALWKAMPTNERRRLLARLRVFWEVHRHRMASAVAERFSGMVERGEVRVVAGSVEAATADFDAVRLTIRERGGNRHFEMLAGWVINCTGPTPSNSAESNPVIGSLLVDGWLRRDELALGIETADDGNAIDAGGNEVRDLLVVGTLRKPALWESTAVPELRLQAATVGERVVAMLGERVRVVA